MDTGRCECILGFGSASHRIVQRFLQYYYKMFLYFQKLAAKNPDPDHFRDYTMLHITHHARQLRQIQLYAPRRSLMLLRSYTYLRDAKDKGFTDIRLMGALTQKLQELMTSLQDRAGTTNRQKPMNVGRMGIKRKLKLWILNNKESNESKSNNRQVNG
jgi:hypothetical protein